ncbi:MAG: hypothetical protein WCH39_12940 [Schlesneria sp.]
MPIKTIVRGYAIAIGLILMTAVTIHMAVSLVERNPWVTLFNGPVAAPQEVAPFEAPPIASEPNRTRVFVAEKSLPLEPPEQSATADNQDAEFDRRAKQLALKFRTANSTEQAKLRQELDSLCEDHFEYRQKQRQREIDQLSNRVDSLRLMQVTRHTNKSEILKRRLNDLLDPDTNLQWESSKTKEELIPTQSKAVDQAGEFNIDSDPRTIKADEPKLVDPAPVVEKTFDGIPYSNWLKMLETERKPEKLATGMEACSRLADPRDERRIAHGIFLAASLFESSDEKEQQLVWNAGWTALKRLPAEVIAEELIVALQDEVSFKAGREFQGKLIAQKVSNAFESLPKERTDVLIAELVRVIQTNVKGTGWLLAGASNVWRNSKRPLSDFESLQSQIFYAADSGPAVTVSGMNDNIASVWKIVVSNLIKSAPETPDLAVRLMKHAGKSSEVVDLIGKLGPHGEPAVPLLVDLFLEEWKLVEAERRDEANHVYHQRSNDETFRHHYRRCQIIQTIGEIGRGQNGYALLRQLGLIAPPKKDRDAQFDGQFYGRVDDALAKFTPAPQSEPKPDLLSDFTFITGRWRFQAMSPGEAPKGATAEFKRSYMQLEEYDGTDFRFEKNSQGFAGFRFELDATKSPKQISLFKYQPESAGRRAGTDTPPTEIPQTRMEGIYELTETTLKIQLNEPGQPRPTELVTDKANLPKRQYLLEFDRAMDEKLIKTATSTQ